MLYSCFLELKEYVSTSLNTHSLSILIFYLSPHPLSLSLFPFPLSLPHTPLSLSLSLSFPSLPPPHPSLSLSFTFSLSPPHLSPDTCCISDFSLAVTSRDSTTDRSARPEPDLRYLAPEFLTEPPARASLENLKKGDMYSYGLVLWEIARRCAVHGE